MEPRALTPYQLILKKRDGGALTPQEVRAFFSAYDKGRLPDYQAAAMLMAVYFRGLDAGELRALVEAMLYSGASVDLSDVAGVKVDKHSTGGVGDKVSIVLAPLVACLGVPVPMMSGRGLGHTGGTVDKLESIPGFRTDLGLDAFRAQMRAIGCALIAQTSEIAPLDRKLYALRDVTGTVESIPLIASSIMSKKLAEGIDALVLDVKEGNGAFLPDAVSADALAHAMIDIGSEHGKRVVALVTAMDRPLGHAIGNALEVEEAVLTLRGEGPPGLVDVTLALAAEMLVLGGAASERAGARALAAAALADGRALEKMRRIVEAQGGNASVFDDPAILPQAPVRRMLEAAATGFVTRIDTRAIGRAAVRLGAGRRRLGEDVDPRVGFHVTAKPGDAVEQGQPLATVFAADPESAEAAVLELREAIEIGASAEPPLPLISRRITAEGVERFDA